VRRSLEKFKVPYDARPFTPHLTIARPADRLPPGQIAADRAALAAYRGAPWPVTRVELVRSVLGSPPAYHRIGSYELIGPAMGQAAGAARDKGPGLE
jgi:2'-5' RNA ligase